MKKGTKNLVNPIVVYIVDNFDRCLLRKKSQFTTLFKVIA